MKTLSLIPAFALLISSLASCTAYEHLAYSAGGNYERDRLVKFGGAASQRGADGSSIATDDQASFQVAAQTLGTYGAGLIANSVAKAHEATTQAANANAAQQAIAAQQAGVQKATIAAQESVAKTAIGAGAKVNPITVTAP